MRGKSESEVAGSSERLTSALIVIGLRLPRPKSSQVYSSGKILNWYNHLNRGSYRAYLFILEPNNRSAEYYKRMSCKHRSGLDLLDQILRVVDDLVSLVSTSSEQLGQSFGRGRCISEQSHRRPWSRLATHRTCIATKEEAQESVMRSGLLVVVKDKAYH